MPRKSQRSQLRPIISNKGTCSQPLVQWDEFDTAVSQIGFGLASVETIRRRFGTSFEACIYRMAQTAAFPAAAGLPRFRPERGEIHASAGLSGELFAIGG